MSSLPAFSLLLPLYHGDRAEFLTAAFSSALLCQSLRPDEVVLVQDGPVDPDLTTAVASIDRTSPVPVRHVRLQENRGLAFALTAGLEACENDIVARMDADDLATPDRFEVQIPMIAAGLDLVGSAMDEFVLNPSGEEQLVGRRIPPLDEVAIRRYLPFHDPFNHPTVVYRKSAVAKAGGYLPLGLMEDYWLFGRMIASGARVGNSSAALVKYRVSSGAYSRRGGLKLLSSELSLQRAFRREGITTTPQYLRNVALRGGYRLVPEAVRRWSYRRLFVR